MYYDTLSAFESVLSFFYICFILFYICFTLFYILGRRGKWYNFTKINP